MSDNSNFEEEKSEQEARNRQDLVAAQMSIPQIRYALEHNAEFFVQFFMQDHLTHEVPEFHKEIFTLMTHNDVDKLALAVPRDHAKTTLAKLACLWYFLFTPWRFIVYVSNTVGIAIPSTNDIIGFMLTDNFQAVFGKIQLPINRDGTGEYKFIVEGKTCFLKAFGMGQQVRGINIDHQRPQLAVLDDIDAFQEEVTEQQFKKSKRWFYGPFRKALDKAKNKMIQIGNLTETQSLIARNCESRFWHSRVYGCILANGQPLWNDFWSIEKLREDFQEYSEDQMQEVWFAEMMNMPTAGGRGVILPEEICYAPRREKFDLDFGFITIDLAISKQTWAHETVICVHGFIPDAGNQGQWQIVDYEGFIGIKPNDLFWKVIDYMAKWNVFVVGIESVAFQASLKFVFEHECLMNGIPVNLDTLPGKYGVAFVPLMAAAQKAQRIVGWASMVKSKLYAINEGDFVMSQQLIAYRPDKTNNTDDYIDCAAYGPQMMKNWMHLIVQKFGPIKQQTYVGSAQYCND